MPSATLLSGIVSSISAPPRRGEAEGDANSLCRPRAVGAHRGQLQTGRVVTGASQARTRSAVEPHMQLDRPGATPPDRTSDQTSATPTEPASRSELHAQRADTPSEGRTTLHLEPNMAGRPARLVAVHRKAPERVVRKVAGRRALAGVAITRRGRRGRLIRRGRTNADVVEIHKSIRVSRHKLLPSHD